MKFLNVCFYKRSLTSGVVLCKSVMNVVNGGMEWLDVKVSLPSNELHRQFSEQGVRESERCSAPSPLRKKKTLDFRCKGDYLQTFCLQVRSRGLEIK